MIHENDLEARVRCRIAYAHKLFYGIGPGEICSQVLGNIVSIKMSRCLTPLEMNLALGGNTAIVNKMREKMFRTLCLDIPLEQITEAKLLDCVFRVQIEEDSVYGMLIFDRILLPNNPSCPESPVSPESPDKG